MPDAGSPRNQSDRGHVLEDLIAQYKSLFWIHFICYLFPQDRIRLPKRRWFGGGSFSFFLFHLAWMIEISLTGSKNFGCEGAFYTQDISAVKNPVKSESQFLLLPHSALKVVRSGLGVAMGTGTSKDLPLASLFETETL